MEFVLEQLQKNKLIFENLFKDEKEGLFLWKQTPEKWCLLEILVIYMMKSVKISDLEQNGF